MRALTFAGFVREDGSWDVDPGFVVEVPELPHQEDDQTEQVRVVARDRGLELASTTLTLGPLCDRASTGAMSPVPTAAGLVDYPEGTTSLTVEREGRVVWESEAPGRPEAAVEWPDSVTRGEVVVRWRASTDGCLAALGWSADGGATTLPVAMPTASPEIVADLSLVAGGKDCRLQLVLTDGWTSQTVSSGPLSLEPGGWLVRVLSPADGAVLETEATVVLSGQAYDLDEHLTSEDLVWTSSLDGGLGQGTRVLTALTSGEHVLRASLGEVSGEVRVSVRPPAW